MKCLVLSMYPHISDPLRKVRVRCLGFTLAWDFLCFSFFVLIETLSITCKKFSKCLKNGIDRLRKGTTAAPYNEIKIAAITVFLTVRQGRISLTSIVIYELHLSW